MRCHNILPADIPFPCACHNIPRRPEWVVIRRYCVPFPSERVIFIALHDCSDSVCEQNHVSVPVLVIIGSHACRICINQSVPACIYRDSRAFYICYDIRSVPYMNRIVYTVPQSVCTSIGIQTKIALFIYFFKVNKIQSLSEASSISE